MANPEFMSRLPENIYIGGFQRFITEELEQKRVCCLPFGDVQKVLNEEFSIDTFAALFHPSLQDIEGRTLYVYGYQPDKIREKIFQYDLDSVIPKLGLTIDKEMRGYFEAHFTKLGLPYAAIALAITHPSKEPLSILYFPNGMSPSDALSEMKEVFTNEDNKKNETREDNSTNDGGGVIFAS